MVELLIAVLVVTVGILALAGTLDSSRRLTSESERWNAAAHTAEREIERIQALRFEQVALKQTPTGVLTGVAAGEPLVVTSGGAVAPGPEEWGGNGSVMRYVTLASDASCPQCPAGRLKRVTVVVTARSDGREKTLRTSALISDPAAGATDATTSPRTECLGADGTVIECAVRTGDTATWYFTDTPLSAGTRQPVTASHDTHATVAPRGGAAAVPDLLSGDPVAASAETPPLYNYSTDVVPGQGFLGGRALRRDTGCKGTPTATDNTKGAMWSTAALQRPLQISGSGGFLLATQGFGGVRASVTLCAAFYDLANSTASPGPSNEIGRVSYSRGVWPTDLSRLAFSFELGRRYELQDGHRLGVRLWVTADSDADIVLAYDHPAYPAHLQLAVDPGN